MWCPHQGSLQNCPLRVKIWHFLFLLALTKPVNLCHTKQNFLTTGQNESENFYFTLKSINGDSSFLEQSSTCAAHRAVFKACPSLPGCEGASLMGGMVRRANSGREGRENISLTLRGAAEERNRTSPCI